MNNIFNKIYITICNSNYNCMENIIIEDCNENDLSSIKSFLNYNEANLNIIYTIGFNSKTKEIRINYKKVK